VDISEMCTFISVVWQKLSIYFVKYVMEVARTILQEVFFRNKDHSNNYLTVIYVCNPCTVNCTGLSKCMQMPALPLCMAESTKNET